MQKINFASKTDADLRRYLKNYCLVIPENEKGKLIREGALRALIDYQNMLLAEEDRRVKVVFHKTGDPAQGDYVFIGHNGRGYQIPFEKEVVIPESVARVCDDAMVTTYKQSALSTTDDIIHDSFHHKLYPYTVIELMDTSNIMKMSKEDDAEA